MFFRGKNQQYLENCVLNEPQPLLMFFRGKNQQYLENCVLNEPQPLFDVFFWGEHIINYVTAGPSGAVGRWFLPVHPSQLEFGLGASAGRSAPALLAGRHSRRGGPRRGRR